MVIFHSYVTVYQRVVGMKQPTMFKFPCFIPENDTFDTFGLSEHRAQNFMASHHFPYISLLIGGNVEISPIFRPTKKSCLLAIPFRSRNPPWYPPWLPPLLSDPPGPSRKVQRLTLRETSSPSRWLRRRRSVGLGWRPARELVPEKCVDRIESGKLVGWLSKKGELSNFIKIGELLRLRLPEAAGKKQETPTASGVNWILDGLDGWNEVTL